MNKPKTAPLTPIIVPTLKSLKQSQDFCMMSLISTGRTKPLGLSKNPLDCLALCNLDNLDRIHDRMSTQQIRITTRPKIMIKVEEPQSPPWEYTSSPTRRAVEPPLRNFTLKDLDHPKSSIKIASISHKLLTHTQTNKQATSAQSKLFDTPHTPAVPASDYFDFEEDACRPNYKKYFVKSRQIRRQDMVYSVRQLVRLKDKRENINMDANAQLQLEIIKRKNAINSLMLNVNMVDKLKVVSDKVYDQFKSETEKVEGIVVNLIKKL